jgi:glyoxylate/hydroxypyruvate reductase A
MAILCRLHHVYGDQLINGIRAKLTNEEIREYPAVDNATDIDVAIIFRMERGFLNGFPNLKMISTTGAGVDHFLLDPDLPRHVPLVRVLDADFGARMADYVLTWILFYHREVAHFQAAQRKHEWAYKPIRSASEVKVSIMGLGQMGGLLARRLAYLGYTVNGWARSRYTIDGVSCYAGFEEFGQFLADTEILVNLLPLTTETRGILSKSTFDRLPAGSILISAGRGGHLIESDLMNALDSGQLRAATIDAFPVEPLPEAHPLWVHPNISVTPHCSSTPSAETIIDAFVENVRRLRAGDPLLNQVNYEKGY